MFRKRYSLKYIFKCNYLKYLCCFRFKRYFTIDKKYALVPLKFYDYRKKYPIMYKVYKPYRFKFIGRFDKYLSTSIGVGTNILRGFSLASVNTIELFTDKVDSGLIKIKEYNIRKLPAKVLNPKIRPFVHKSVVVVKHISININKTFDSLVKALIYCVKSVARVVGNIFIWILDYINNKSKYSYFPRTIDSTKKFIDISVDEGFVIIEEIDESITKLFDSFTDTTLETVEHVFGEDVRDLTEEISVISRETLEFYKRIKLLKVAKYKQLLKESLQDGAVKEIREIYVITKNDEQEKK